jgi:hypothetical protein
MNVKINANGIVIATKVAVPAIAVPQVKGNNQKINICKLYDFRKTHRKN